MKKLEITKKLEDMGDRLYRDDFVAILNMPAANFCGKRAELIVMPDGKLRQSCEGCVTQTIGNKDRLSMDQIREVIDYFSQEWGTKFLTVNGRGEVFYPVLREETAGKIRYAGSRGMQSYIFTPGNDLDAGTIRFLADNETIVMISLYGNPFIDADFFTGKQYPSAEGRLQNQARIAGNIRRLIDTYRESPKQPEEGATRIGMNYVVSEMDIQNPARLSELKEAAEMDGIYFQCNTPFQDNYDPQVQQKLKNLTDEYSTLHNPHTTVVNGQCQMGAKSGVTIDYNGNFFECPYMDGRGDGNFFGMTDSGRREVVRKYLHQTEFECTKRRTPVVP